MMAGALAGKISGAGGGGYFMFFVPPSKRMQLVRQLQKREGQVVNFHFTSIGSQSWVQNKIEGDVCDRQSRRSTKPLAP
jgi:D-glycero-alpha-D-manno-heptose-7-phosphate kinase